MTDIEDYKNLLSDLVKKQMVMLGPNVALGIAKKVEGLSVGEDGTVVEISGDPHVAMESLSKEYLNLSGQIAQTTLKTILEKYPNIKK